MTLHFVLLLLEQRLMSEARWETKTTSLKEGEFVRSSQTKSNEGKDTKVTHGALIDNSMVPLKHTLLCQAIVVTQVLLELHISPLQMVLIS